MRQRKTLRVSVLFLMIVSAALAQTDRARLVGLVTDSSGAFLPGATVTVTNVKTGEERTATSNDLGFYVVPNLQPTIYKVVAKTKDLGPAQYTDIGLSVGQERTLNLILQPSSMVQEVNVSGGQLS